MQVYKCFLQILRKRIGSIIMYMSIFVVLCIATSTQGKQSEEVKFEASTYSFAVFDEDQSEISRGITDYLSADNTLVTIPDTKESLQDEIYNRNIHCAIRIQPGFAQKVKEGAGDEMIEITAVPGTVYGETFKQSIDGYMQILRTYLTGGYSDADALKRTKQAVELKAEVELADASNDGTYSKLYYFFKYLAYIYVVVCIEVLGSVLINFRQKTVRDRMESSPYPLWKASMEQYAGMITMGLGLFVIHILMLLSLRMNCFSYRGLLFLLNELCFIGVTMAIVFLVGQVASNRTVLSMIANVAGLGMSFLCGVFVPLSLMGDQIVMVAHLLPAYWYIRACQQIDFMVPGESLEPVLSSMGVELLFGAALICIGMAYSRSKQA